MVLVAGIDSTATRCLSRRVAYIFASTNTAIRVSVRRDGDPQVAPDCLFRRT